MTMTYIEIGVSNLDRSWEFYSGLLGFAVTETDTAQDGRRTAWLGTGAGRIKLVEAGPGAPATNWADDDRQCGIRHFGMKVADVDEWSDRLKRHQVEFRLEPFDAFGNVRIAFFFDPDGAYLEFVQGYVRHNNLWSPELVQREIDGDRDWDGRPRFDHVAITVPDLDEARTFYADGLGFGPIGQLVQPENEDGFLITNLRAGPGTLEVFTFDVPTHRRDGESDTDRLGLRAVGVRHEDGPKDATGPGDVPLRLES